MLKAQTHRISYKKKNQEEIFEAIMVSLDPNEFSIDDARKSLEEDPEVESFQIVEMNNQYVYDITFEKEVVYDQDGNTRTGDIVVIESAMSYDDFVDMYKKQNLDVGTIEVRCAYDPTQEKE